MSLNVLLAVVIVAHEDRRTRAAVRRALCCCPGQPRRIRRTSARGVRVLVRGPGLVDFGWHGAHRPHLSRVVDAPGRQAQSGRQCCSGTATAGLLSDAEAPRACRGCRTTATSRFGITGTGPSAVAMVAWLFGVHAVRPAAGSAAGTASSRCRCSRRRRGPCPCAPSGD